jgi:hypothetical protein
MTFVLVCHGLATEGVETPPELVGQYLQSFDVNAHDGMGTAEWTVDVNKAMRFADLVEAIETWQTRSVVRPLRADGKPNRPLTAFSVEPKPL